MSLHRPSTMDPVPLPSKNQTCRLRAKAIRASSNVSEGRFTGRLLSADGARLLAVVLALPVGFDLSRWPVEDDPLR